MTSTTSESRMPSTFEYQWQYAHLLPEPGATVSGPDSDKRNEGLGEVTFAYIDSGAPTTATASYPTLVCLAGHSYNAHIFSPVLARAAERGLRVIAVNRRDYAPSSLLSADELAEIHAQDEVRRTRYLRARGAEIARFLVYVAQRVSNESDGPIALLGWSLATIFAVSSLAHVPSYPPHIVSALEKRLTMLIIHDSALNVIGYAPIRGTYHPLADPELAGLTDDARAEAFQNWLTAYFEHPFHSAGGGGMPALAPEEDSAKLAALMLRADGGSELRHTPLPNTDAAAYKRSIDLAPGPRSESAFYGPTGVKPSTLLAQFYSAVGITPAGARTEQDPAAQAELESSDMPLPGLKVVYLCGTHSLPTIQLGAWAVAKDVVRARRPVDIVPVAGGNHYVHWDNPDGFLDVVLECMHNSSAVADTDALY